MLSRCVSTIIAAGIAAILAAPAQAQGTQPGTQPTPPAPADIEAKAQLCSVCHGASGTPLDPKTMPNIWGQQPYYILTQLVHYRNGMRENPVMVSIAKGLQQSDLRPLAAYFAAKPWPAASNAPAAPVCFEGRRRWWRVDHSFQDCGVMSAALRAAIDVYGEVPISGCRSNAAEPALYSHAATKRPAAKLALREKPAHSAASRRARGPAARGRRDSRRRPVRRRPGDRAFDR